MMMMMYLFPVHINTSLMRHILQEGVDVRQALHNRASCRKKQHRKWENPKDFQ